MQYRIVLSIFCLALGACGNRRTGGPLDYLAYCKPGGSTRECSQRLDRLPANMFPAGRLEGIEFRAQAIGRAVTGRHTGKFEDGLVFFYAMKFNVGRDDVMQLLEAELGEPMGNGEPPVHTPEYLPGTFWRTAEGVWVCGEKAVAWYSDPIHNVDSHDWARDLDRYDRPVPTTAALWDKIGRMLIGADTDPRQSPTARSASEREDEDRNRAFTLKLFLLVGSVVCLFLLWLWHRFRGSR